MYSVAAVSPPAAYAVCTPMATAGLNDRAAASRPPNALLRILGFLSLSGTGDAPAESLIIELFVTMLLCIIVTRGLV